MNDKQILEMANRAVVLAEHADEIDQWEFSEQAQAAALTSIALSLAVIVEAMKEDIHGS